MPKTSVRLEQTKEHLKNINYSKTNSDSRVQIWEAAANVINTNYCHISVCKSKYRNKLIILSAIDNLIKGGAGQAVQNLNYYFGYNEKKGLV